MCTAFWDRRGILLVNFLTEGEMVNAERYCETLQKLWWTIQNKRRVMFSTGIVLMHDTAWLEAQHNSCRRSAERCLMIHPIVRTSRQWFPCFLHLKKFMSGQCQRFHNDKEAEISVTHWFQSQTANFFYIVTNVGPTVWQMSQFRRSISEVNTLKNSSTKFFH